MYGEDLNLALSSCRRPTPPRWSVELASSLDAPVQSWQPPMKLNSAGRSPDLLSNLKAGEGSFRLEILDLYKNNPRCPPGVSPLFWAEQFTFLREVCLAVVIQWPQWCPNLFSKREGEKREKGTVGSLEMSQSRNQNTGETYPTSRRGKLVHISTPWTSLLTSGAYTTSTPC